MARAEASLCSITDEGVILAVHVQPRASKNEVCGRQENALKIRLTSPPVDGAANRMCREFLAELFHVSRSSVEILSGETSRHKRVRITSNEPQRLCRIIESLSAD